MLLAVSTAFQNTVSFFRTEQITSLKQYTIFSQSAALNFKMLDVLEFIMCKADTGFSAVSDINSAHLCVL
jgi:hypothetical protein